MTKVTGGGRFWLVLTLLIVALASIGRFQNGYVIDDTQMILEGTSIHDPANLPRYFVAGAMESSDGTENENLSTYRPLALVTMTLSSMVSGREPWAFHASGWLLHLGVVALLFAAVRSVSDLRGDRAAVGLGAAVAAALWFGLHPGLGEAHVWINGRSDTIATLGVLGSLVCLLQTRRVPVGRRLGWELLAGGLLLAACLGKEPALLTIPALGMAAAGSAVGAPRSVWARLRPTAVLVLAGVLFLVLRANAVGGAVGPGLSLSAVAGPVARLGWLWSESAAHVLVPLDTGTRVMGDRYVTLPLAQMVAGWILSVVVMVAAVASVRRRPELTWALVGFALPLAPVSLLTVIYYPGWGRYMYLPAALLAAGAFPVVGSWLAARFGALPQASSVRARSALVAIASISLVWWVVGTRRVVSDYRDLESFYAASARDWPESAYGPMGLGRIAMRRGDYAAAIPLLESALVRGSDQNHNWALLAEALVFGGRPQDGYAVATRALVTVPDSVEFQNLAGLAAMQFAPDRSARHWLACLPATPCVDNLLRAARTHPHAAVYREAVEAGDAPPGSPLEALRRELATGGEGQR